MTQLELTTPDAPTQRHESQPAFASMQARSLFRPGIYRDAYRSAERLAG